MIIGSKQRLTNIANDPKIVLGEAEIKCVDKSVINLCFGNQGNG